MNEAPKLMLYKKVTSLEVATTPLMRLKYSKATKKIKEMLNDPTAAQFVFEDSDVGISFEVNDWLYWLNMLGEFK